MKKSIVTLGCSAFIALSLFAQDETLSTITVNAKTSAKTVSLNRLIQDVNRAHPEVLIKQFEYEQTKSDKDIAQSVYYPKIDVTSSVGYEENDYKSSETNGEFSDIAIDSTFNLYNGGSDYYDNKYYALRAKSSKHSLEELRGKVLLNGIDAYLDVLKNYEMYVLSKKVSQRYLEFYSKMKRKYNHGAGTLLEISKSKGMYDTALIDLNNQRNAYDVAVISLNYYTQDVGYEDRFMFPHINFDVNMNFDEALDIAYDNHPSLKVAYLNKQMASSQYYRDLKGFHPKIDVKANYTVTDSEITTLENEYDVKLQLQYNLFNGLKDYSTAAKNRKRINENVQLIQKAKLDINKRLKLAYNNYESIQKRLEFLMNYYRSQTVSLYSMYKEYELGKASLTNLVQTEEDYVQTQKNIIRANYDLLSTKFSIIDMLGDTPKLLGGKMVKNENRYIYQDLEEIEYKKMNMNQWLDE